MLKLVPDNTNIGFLKWRHVAMAISMISIIASIALVATRGLNLGVDFVGGQMMRVTFSQPVNLDALRGTVDAAVAGEVNIQQFGSAQDVSIRTSLPEGGEDAANQAAERLKAAILKSHPDAKFGSVDTVSGKVSGELFQTGAWSMFFAMLAISIYIWFRFEWQFGLGALFALFHDVALTFGLFALTQMEFNLNIVAALLTIIGYSLNDTIVIYDRIRENLRKYRKMELVPLLDLSINETLARTVMTSLTIIITLVVLLLLGPEVIFGFTAAMLFGIFVGTYSSMYMSAPLLVWTKVGSDSFVAKAGGQVAGAERTLKNETMPR
ncbi:preprotein translocase subunit SecF [Sphingobium sp. B7D2B]|nr:preprotein translocase subunit SecF [Sphingobium sp. B10D3B]MCW2366780.1 preprotein translocase subunit SecF [Sphingobium sp. B7D2B]MCW2401897.1 preprotein translocase subunit SecF [Sphingobium sp. B10D7B]MCW2408876.1 preprotein translocase subunit SecF [Sphingobium xanthum]